MGTNSYIAIAARNETEAYVCWDINQQTFSDNFGPAKRALTLYICDITNIQRLDIPHDSPPLNGRISLSLPSLSCSVINMATEVQSYSVSADIHEYYVTIPSLHHDYVAEIGYIDNQGEWQMLTQSLPLHMYPIHPAE